MRKVEVLSIVRLSPADQARIAAVDPAVSLTYAGGWFDGEIRETWPAYSGQRYLPAGTTGEGTRTERDAMLGRAEVILGGFPFPLDLRARSPNLKWFHQRPAGASNLRGGDIWDAGVTATTSRGVGNALAIAEYAIAGILHFAKGLHPASFDQQAQAFTQAAYRPRSIAGKTLCVVGVGGIGREVGRLAAALGMRVVGTRRSRPAPDEALPQGFAEVVGTDDLDRLLAQSDFVAICAQWTPQNTGLIDAGRLAAMKPDGVLVNVARGEIVDEAALAEALARGHLRGVATDVYVGEFERAPPEALWRDPRVLITPHTSGMTDLDQHGGVGIFCENLRAYLDGQPLQNVIDWQRGY